MIEVQRTTLAETKSKSHVVARLRYSLQLFNSEYICVSIAKGIKCNSMFASDNREMYLHKLCKHAIRNFESFYFISTFQIILCLHRGRISRTNWALNISK